MLICDICEEAFHASCCRPKKRKLPVYEWYCQPCSGKKPKPLIDQKSGRSCNSVDGLPGKKIIASWGVLDSIRYMLQDNQPYATGSESVKIFKQKFRVVWSNIWCLATELMAGLLSSCLYNEQMRIPPSSCSFRDFLQVHDRVQDSCADGLTSNSLQSSF